MPGKTRIPVALILALLVGEALSAQGTRIAVGAPEEATRTGVMKQIFDQLRAGIKDEPGSPAFLLFLIAATGYGVLHALGPGHQKTLISGYLLAEGGGFLRVAAAAGIASASHAFSVIALFGGLLLFSGGLSAARAESAGLLVARASGLLLVLLALRLLFKRIADARRRLTRNFAPEACCTVHAQSRDLDHKAGLRGGLLFFGSLVPCPGAAFFLLLGFSAGNPGAGILAVAAISVGMWITLVAVGSAALLVRQAGMHQAGRKSTRTSAWIRSAFEISGSALVLVFAVALLF